jgi:SAM-dependent methyltransferase
MQTRPALRVDTDTQSAHMLAAKPHAQAATLSDILPLLMSPDSGAALELQSHALSDGTHHYPLKGEVVMLLPERLHAHFTDRLTVPPDYGYDAFMQYFLLSSLKQYGETNAASTNMHYERHLHRMADFCNDASGLALDIGCDDPRIGASLLPVSARYVGLDPFCTHPSPFRLIGVGEYIPFQDATLDAVLFNTSLDHLLDWRRGIDEAYRILKSGGALYLSTLLWTQRADLLQDTVHFHHFREYEILGGLEESGLHIERVERYDYKGDAHRYGAYIKARKP